MSWRAEKKIMLGQLLTRKTTNHKISGADIKERRGSIQEQQAESKRTLVLAALLTAVERV